MRIAVLSISFLLAINCLHGQLPDSVQVEVSKRSNPKDQLSYLDDLASKALRSNTDLHLRIVKEGIAIAESTNNDSIANYFYLKAGTHYTYQNQLDTARFIFNDLLRNQTDQRLKALIFSELGITYYYESNDTKTLEYFIQSFELYEQLRDTAKMAGLTNNIGAIYRYLEDYEGAERYLKKAIEYKLMMGDSTVLGSSYHNLGINYVDKNQPDSALKYLNMARGIRLKYQDQRGLAKTYTSLGAIYKENGKLDSAEMYIRKAIFIDKALDDQVALSSDELSLAEIQFEQKAFESGIRLAEQVLKKTNDARLKKSVLSFLSRAYTQVDEFYKANEIKGQLIALMDSVYKAEKETALNELQVQFDTEQKETEIKQLSAENQIQKLQAEQDAQTRLILIIVAAALIVITLLLYSRFQSKAKSNALLQTKNRELAKLNQTKDRLFSIISHDLKSPLSSFHTITNSLSENWDQLEKEQLKDFIESLRDSSANVRDMMDNLLKWALAQTDQLQYTPEEVNVSTILDKVTDQLKSVSQLKSIHLKSDVLARKAIKADSQFVEIVLRNILNNALKFSEMESEISIAIQEESNRQIISIADRGVGMDQQQIDRLLKGEIIAQDIQNSTEKGTGLGLTLCKELMDKMGAQMEVHSEKNKGTTFKLIFNQAA